MPVVPSYKAPRVEPTVSAPQFGNGPMPGQVAGRELEQLGGALENSGAQVGAIAQDAQAQVDNTRLNSALNDAHRATIELAEDKDIGFKAARGLTALKRDSGKPLPDEYEDKLQARLSEITKGLSTDRQRSMFQEKAVNLATRFRADTEQHFRREFETHAIATNEATIDLAASEATANWNDPGRVRESLDRAKAALYEKGQRLGYDGAQQKAAQDVVTSKVHSTVILAALEAGDPVGANKYLEANKAEMNGDSILKVRSHVDRAVIAHVANGIGSATEAEMTPRFVAPTPFAQMSRITGSDSLPAMVRVTMRTESNGQRYGPDGKTLLTSPKGAKGEMQVLDGTNTDPGFGVKPARDNSPDERARVGRDYLQAMVQRYGEPAKAWAAYNAGPGAVDKAMKEGGDWLSRMPKETRDYVAKNMRALGAPVSVQPPTEAEFISRAEARLPAGAPAELVSKVREDASKRFGMLSRSAKDQEQNTVREVQQFIIANPGSFDSMPPALRERLAANAPGQFAALKNFSEALSKPEAIETDLVVYNRLSDPQVLRSMPNEQFEMFRAKLNPADFKHFANERNTLLAGKSTNGPGELNSQAISHTLESRLQTLGINLKSKDEGEIARIGTIRRLVDGEVAEAQRQAGKKLSDVETAQVIDRAFSQNVAIRSSFLGMGSTKSQPVLAMKAGDVPDDARKALTDAFKAKGISDPTPAQLLGAYQYGKLRKGTF